MGGPQDAFRLAWPVRQWQPCRQYHTRPRVARRAISPKTTRDTRGHSRSRPAAHVVASMSLLRRPDDHHRDLRARLPAKKPPHTGSASDQDRYLMTLSPLTDNRPDTHSCGHLVAGNAQARRGPLDRPAVAPQMLPELQSVPSPPRVHPTSALTRSPQAPRSKPLTHHAALKSP